MKSYAETSSIADSKPTSTSIFSRLKITEHQLSLGLLALSLLAGAGYGIWVAISPLLPSGNDEAKSAISRLQDGREYREQGQWNKAIDIYQSMLVSDPDNGFARALLASSIDQKWRESWKNIPKPDSSDKDAETGPQLPFAEQENFQAAVENLNKLLDHARYRNWAYESLASIYSFRFSVSKDRQDADRAIGFLEAMIDKEITTAYGIQRNSDLLCIRSHPSFKDLVTRETEILGAGDFRFGFPRGK